MHKTNFVIGEVALVQGAWITVVGKVVDDVELRETAKGSKVCNINLRVVDSSGHRTYFNVTAWAENADAVSVLKVGDEVEISGAFWIKRDVDLKDDTKMYFKAEVLYAEGRLWTGDEFKDLVSSSE